MLLRARWCLSKARSTVRSGRSLDVRADPRLQLVSTTQSDGVPWSCQLPADDLVLDRWHLDNPDTGPFECAENPSWAGPL